MAIEFPADFDPERIAWNPELSDGNIGTDPLRPGFVVRRAMISPNWMWNPDTHAWEPDQPGPSYAVPAFQADIQCNKATHEFDLLEASGIQIPDHSDFVRLTPETTTFYSYVERLNGDEFNPTSKEHSQFVIPYGEAAIRYLGSKVVNDAVLEDCFLARNHTVEQSRLTFHDLDPFVEPVIPGSDEPGSLRVQYGTYHDLMIQDLVQTLMSANYTQQADESRARELLHKIEDIAN